jgi:uncharacterized membrane protein
VVLVTSPTHRTTTHLGRYGWCVWCAVLLCPISDTVTGVLMSRHPQYPLTTCCAWLVSWVLDRMSQLLVRGAKHGHSDNIPSG